MNWLFGDYEGNAILLFLVNYLPYLILVGIVGFIVWLFIKLNIGNAKIIGILALASKEREKFTAQQGVELLKFMGSVFERRISHWLN